MKKYKFGFTLIELLVVIAIIGILSSIVLVSLKTSRDKAKDASIKQQLVQLRSQGALYYSNSGNYGSASAGNCDFAGSFFVDSKVDPIIEAVKSLSGMANVVCNSTAGTGGAYAVSADLVVETGYWCVDSTSASRQITSALGGATVCPVS